jgi:hypothetical protein
MPNKISDWEVFLENANIYDLTMLPGESHEGYEKHLRGLYEEFTPQFLWRTFRF